MKYSVVIPVYNSQESISEVVNQIVLHFKKNFEIILVNDGSVDNSLEKCFQLSQRHNQVHVLNLSKNFGQHNAIMAGLNQAKGNLVICMDDDMQTPPSEIVKLVECLENNDFDVVYANYKEKKHNVFRNIASDINNRMANKMIDKPLNIKITSFFVMRKFVVSEIIKYKYSFPYIGGLICRTTSNIGNVYVTHYSREMGKSNYNFRKLFSLWLNGFLNFSVKPLRISSFMGAILAIFGFVFIILISLNKLINEDVYLGWTSIMAAIIFFGGINLMGMGIIGEYVGRSYLNVNEKPQFVVRDESDGK